jgi:hypothetical protein
MVRRSTPARARIASSDSNLDSAIAPSPLLVEIVSIGVSALPALLVSADEDALALILRVNEFVGFVPPAGKAATSEQMRKSSNTFTVTEGNGNGNSILLLRSFRRCCSVVVHVVLTSP